MNFLKIEVFDRTPCILSIFHPIPTTLLLLHVVEEFIVPRISRCLTSHCSPKFDHLKYSHHTSVIFLSQTYHRSRVNGLENAIVGFAN